jgi:hypothetical protein
MGLFDGIRTAANNAVEADIICRRRVLSRKFASRND